MKQIKIYVFLVGILCSSLCFSQAESAKEKLNYYLVEAGKAIKQNDLSFACDLLRHSLIFAESVDGGTHYSKVKKMSSDVCQASLNSALTNYSNAIKNHPYTPYCGAYRRSKQICAAAIDFDSCMSKSFGPLAKSVTDSMVCN
jgi:hypothetical protein